MVLIVCLTRGHGDAESQDYLCVSVAPCETKVNTTLGKYYSLHPPYVLRQPLSLSLRHRFRTKTHHEIHCAKENNIIATTSIQNESADTLRDHHAFRHIVGISLRHLTQLNPPSETNPSFRLRLP